MKSYVIKKQQITDGVQLIFEKNVIVHKNKLKFNRS